ncbi:MAG: hypothetical protein OEZ36_03515 [Spirochaetota bacterium]|nr:hypothetical protein [Spirochaetota bacterium]
MVKSITRLIIVCMVFIITQHEVFAGEKKDGVQGLALIDNWILPMETNDQINPLSQNYLVFNDASGTNPTGQEKNEKAEKDEGSDKSVNFGLISGYTYTQVKSSGLNLPFLPSVKSADLVTVGMFVEILALNFLAIETGINARFFKAYSSTDRNSGMLLDITEGQIPFYVKYRMPLRDIAVFNVGVGLSYYFQSEGEISDGANSIALPKTDLKNDVSFLCKIDLQLFLGKTFFLQTSVGYEYSNRSFDIKGHDLHLLGGIGFSM